MFESKHEKRVNECYPQGSGEQGPVAGKISSLTYYINAKPAKLLKVAAYLERKAPRDLVKQSADFNAVTLEIVRGIMSNCSEYFVSFAPTVLRILILFNDSSLATRLKKPLNEMFVECCKLTKAVLPSIRDAEFFDLLTRVSETMLYTEVIMDQSDQELIADNIQAAVAMEDFRGPKGADRIDIIIRAVICFFRSRESTQIDATSILQRPTGKPEPMQIVGLSFVNLVEGSNSTTVPLLLDCLFRQFDTDKWIHQRLGGGLLNILIYSVPAQFLCVVLSEFFRKLEETEDNVTTVLANTIAELLRSNRSPLGYSGLELARNLLKLLRKQRPDATEATRASIIQAKVRPPRTIYAISTAFVALLRNANFALQKYEIIEYIIQRSFFGGSGPDGGRGAAEQALSFGESSQLTLPISANERHSMLTVTLNQSEEYHFRSVVWGILFSLAEEGSSSSVLRLAFVEVQVKLFETLFKMVRIGDEDFVLNTLVFWRQLLVHGLPIAPNRRGVHAGGTSDASTAAGGASSLSPKPSPAGTSGLGRPSLLILANTRLALAYLASSKDLALSLMHVTAIMSLIGSFLGECDLAQLWSFLTFTNWLYGMFSNATEWTIEDRACTTLFALKIMREIAVVQRRLCGITGEGSTQLMQLIEGSLKRLYEAGMEDAEMDDILDAMRPVFSLFHPSDENVKLNTIIPSDATLGSAFRSSCNQIDLPNDLYPYSIQKDQEFIAGIGTTAMQGRGPEKATFSRSTLPVPMEPSRLSRLSRLGVGTGASLASSSAITAPAFYQSDMTGSGGIVGTPMRALTVSSSSLAHSDTHSLANTSLATGGSVSGDPLEERFDQLSVKMKEKRQKDRATSMLLFNKSLNTNGTSDNK